MTVTIQIEAIFEANTYFLKKDVYVNSCMYVT